MTNVMHRKRNGNLVPLSEMTTYHLLNTMNMLVRNSKEGVTIKFGSVGEDIFYDEQVIKGDDYLIRMNYLHYAMELASRIDPITMELELDMPIRGWHEPKGCRGQGEERAE